MHVKKFGVAVFVGDFTVQTNCFIRHGLAIVYSRDEIWAIPLIFL